MIRRRLPLLLACVAPTLLSGCVAAAIPVLAGAVVAKKEVLDDKPAPAPALPPQPGPPRVAVFVGEGSASASLDPATIPGAKATIAKPGKTGLPGDASTSAPPPVPLNPVPIAPIPVTAELQPTPPVPAPSVPAPAPPPVKTAPPPATPLAAEPSTKLALATPAAKPKVALLPTVPSTPRSNGYLGLTGFVLSRVGAPQSDSVLDVIDAADPLGAPRRAQCGGLPPAIVIDLDPGVTVFNPATIRAEPGLAESLAAIRAAGVTVMWASARQVEDAEKIHAALARMGLDPTRTDRLLLLKGPGDRKQARRQVAARNWCVIAMAGDRRGDFDEVFDYLKDPETTLPADALFGDGWFMAPPPAQP